MKHDTKTKEMEKFIPALEEVERVIDEYYNSFTSTEGCEEGSFIFNCGEMDRIPAIKYMKCDFLIPYEKQSECGVSSCRLCGKNNGMSTYIVPNDGITYVWPSGYMHYLKDHNVIASDGFRQFIEGLDDLSERKLPDIGPALVQFTKCEKAMNGNLNIHFS